MRRILRLELKQRYNAPELQQLLLKFLVGKGVLLSNEADKPGPHAGPEHACL
jgi:hypothetical protein